MNGELGILTSRSWKAAWNIQTDTEFRVGRMNRGCWRYSLDSCGSDYREVEYEDSDFQVVNSHKYSQIGKITGLL